MRRSVVLPYLVKLKGGLPASRRFWIFALSAGLGGFSWTLIGPFFSLFLRERFGLSMSAIALLSTMGEMVGLAMSLPAGYLADKFGRKGMLLLSQGASSLYLFLLTKMRNFGQLLSLNIATQLFSSLGHSSGESLIADLVREERRNAAYGIIRVVNNTAWIIGPTAAGVYLGRLRNYDHLFYLSASLGFLALAILAAFVPETRRKGLPPPNILTLRGLLNRNFACLCLSIFFCMLAYFQMYTILPVTAKEKGLNEALIGTLMATSGATVVSFQLPTSIIVGKVERKKGLLLAILLLGLGSFGFGLLRSFYGLAASMFVLTIGESIFFPEMTVLATELAPEAERATYLGTFGLTFGLGRIVSTLLGGFVWDISGNGSLPFLLSPLYVLVSMLALLSFRYEKRRIGMEKLEKGV